MASTWEIITLCIIGIIGGIAAWAGMRESK
jgi:hypothetical protein